MSNIIGPKSKFQEEYLNADADVMVVGGAMGSSKTYVGLMRHLRWVHLKEYRGYCIRKNSTTIMKSGGLFDDAIHLYSQVAKIQIKRKDQKIVFPSGAEIAFSGYEDRKSSEKYRGLQLSSAFYDEGTDAEEEDIWFLISRLRTRAKMKPSLWISCNPNPDSYLFKYVEWYLYPRGHELEGRPDPAKNGKIRWMYRYAGDIVWADDVEEIYERFGRGKNVKPLSFKGLFGTIYDNPILMETQPHYLANLEGQTRVSKERNLYGNWFAREEASGFFKRDWLHKYPQNYDEKDFIKIVRAWDLAGSVKSELCPDPDYTASVKIGKTRSGDYVILDAMRFRARYGEVVDKIIDTAFSDGCGVDIVVPRDPGAAGQAASNMLVRSITEAGFYVRARPTNKSKIDRFKPFAAAAEHGLVHMRENCVDDLENRIFSNNNVFLSELEKFDGGRKYHDDFVDAVGDGFMALAQNTQLCNFVLPDLVQENPFNVNI